MVLLAVAVLSAACLVVALLLSNAKVKAPDFSGMTLMEAAKDAQENDLVVKDGQKVDGSEADRGKVVDQQPEPGTSMKPGEVVMVTICRGPGDGRTPNVINMSSEEATGAIESAGFHVGSVNTVPGVEKAGTVIGQDPKADKEYERGKTINIDVSDGTMVYVPNLIGKDAESAYYTLKNSALAGEYAGSEFSSKIEIDHVLKQKPGAGAKVRKGTTVLVWLSDGDEEDYY